MQNYKKISTLACIGMHYFGTVIKKYAIHYLPLEVLFVITLFLPLNWHVLLLQIISFPISPQS